jgi:hypothetical protein
VKITQDVRVYAAKQNGGLMYMTAALSWHGWATSERFRLRHGLVLHGARRGPAELIGLPKASFATAPWGGLLGKGEAGEAIKWRGQEKPRTDGRHGGWSNCSVCA